MFSSQLFSFPDKVKQENIVEILRFDDGFTGFFLHDWNEFNSALDSRAESSSLIKLIYGDHRLLLPKLKSTHLSR